MKAGAVRAAVDNDIILKAVAYRLSATFWPGLGETTIGLLGAARYVIPNRLDRAGLSGDAPTAKAEFAALLATAAALEPNRDELRLAAEIETAAQRASLPLDSGESQLAAMVMERSIPTLETGDKRAVRSLESLRGHVDFLERLDCRIRCFEQVVHRLVSDEVAFRSAAAAVCAEPSVDKTLTICFACRSPAPAPRERVMEGLESYIASLRAEAPNVLADS